MRLARNSSQEDLAFKSGLHRTYLGGIERGERNPSLKNIAAIAKALNISLEELFTSLPNHESDSEDVKDTSS